MTLPALILMAALAQEGAPPEGPIPLETVWDEGLRFRTPDRAYDVHLGGRIFADIGFLSASRELEEDLGPLENGSEIRSARLRANGRLFDSLDFSLSADFAGDKTKLKTAWLRFPGLPLSTDLQVGLQKEPFGLEWASLVADTVFLDRGLGNGLLDLRNPGATLRTALFDDRATLALGAFRESDDTTVSLEDGGGAFTARATALPWRGDDGARLAHLGLSYTRRNPADGEVAFAHRPETRLAPDFVDTGTFEADAVDALALEGALLFGPATLQAEMFQVRAGGPGTEATHLRGGYALAAFMLTGERRPYRARRGAFGKIRPLEDFFEGGPGAWEIAVRESWLDLDDPPVRGGTMHNVTLGLNWHLNAHLRISVNAIHSEREEGGRAEMLLLRIALVF